MLCLGQLHARCVPNQRLRAFIFLCGEVKEVEMPPRNVKTLQMPHRLMKTNESVTMVNNTQGLAGIM